MRGVSVLAFAGLLAVPFLLDSLTAYQLGLYILYGMVGQGIALCWGRTGFLPLGQALFFGIGAYVAGAVLRTDAGWLLILPAFALACLLPALLAGFVGALVFNRQIGSGPYLSLITLALAMLGFQLANSLDGLTGGFNGMTGIAGLPGIDTYETLYFVIVGVFALVTLLLAHVLRAFRTVVVSHSRERRTAAVLRLQHRHDEGVGLRDQRWSGRSCRRSLCTASGDLDAAGCRFSAVGGTGDLDCVWRPREPCRPGDRCGADRFSGRRAA